MGDYALWVSLPLRLERAGQHKNLPNSALVPVFRSGAMLFALAVPLVPTTVHADVLPPKVCVVVASDPDPAVRQAAQGLSTALASRTDVRTIADADTAAALRGEPSTSPWSERRRALVGTDADLNTLATLGDPLGCTYWVEFAARPAGLLVRTFDTVGKRFLTDREVPSFGPAVVESVVTTVQTNQTARTSTGTNTPNTGQGTVPTQAVDPRAVAPKDNSNRGPGVVGWVVAGGAVAALLTAFLVVAFTSGPSVPTVSVIHQGVSLP